MFASSRAIQPLVRAVTVLAICLVPTTALAGGPKIVNPGTRHITTLGTPVTIWADGTSPLTGMSGSIKLVASCGSGDPDCTLAISETTGLTSAVGYDAANWLTGAPELGFVGSRADINAALGSMTVALSAAKTTTVTINATASNVAALELEDGMHYYEFVTEDGNVTWVNARTLATARTLNGLDGYLASVTSEEEGEFIGSKVGGSSAWLGGNDTDTEGTWVWADAPETDPFWIDGTCGQGLRGMCSIGGTDHYNFWSDGEPNQSGDEDALQILSGGSGYWNDLPANSHTMPYVVEYSGPTSGGGSDSASRTFTISTELPDTSRDGSGLPPAALVAAAILALAAGTRVLNPTLREEANP
jgi:hypothetical protein